MIIGVLVFLSLILALLGYIGYTILTYHRQEAEERAGCGCFLFCLVGVPIVIQATLFVRTIPKVLQVRTYGLDLAEIHQASHISETTSRFWELKRLLPELRERVDAPDDPIWSRARDEIRDRLRPAVRFGRDAWATFVTWGASLSDAAPPVTEERAIIAAVERLTGEDQLPVRIRQYGTDVEQFQLPDRTSIQLYVEGYIGQSLAMHLFYLNEDVALLYFGSSVGGTGWNLFGARKNQELSEIEEVCLDVVRILLVIAVMLVLAFAIQRCFRWLTLSLIGRILWLGKDDHFLRFEREVYDPMRYLVTLTLFALIGLPLYLLTIEPYLILNHPTYWAFFLACLWKLLFAGILVEGIEHLVGTLFLRFGLDPMTTVWDNLVASLLAIALLLVFHNGWVAIFLALGIGMAQSLIAKFALAPSR